MFCRAVGYCYRHFSYQFRSVASIPLAAWRKSPYPSSPSLSPPSLSHAFNLFFSLSSPSLYPYRPTLSPFLFPPLFHGAWEYNPQKTLANLNVRIGLCILMCIVYTLKTVIEYYVKHGSTVTICALNIQQLVLTICIIFIFYNKISVKQP